MKTNWILIRYGEIALKSEHVRKRFEDRLMNNMRAGFKDKGIGATVKRGYGRIFVKTDEIEGASEVLSRTFGIVSFSPCAKLESEYEEVVEEAAEAGTETIEDGETFAVRARRTGSHEFSSKDIEKDVGSEIIEETGAGVDLDDPDKTVYVEVRQGQAYIFTEKIEGPGGMPVGTQGEVISLLKGDCGSFLATWLMMKRGCKVTLLHADMSPYTPEDGIEKAVDVLKRWSHGATMDFIGFDFGDELFKIQENVEGMTCVLCKRFLLRIASRLAEREGFKAVVSGEGPGRSFRSFKLEDSAADLPVLRPLVGFSKDEVRKKCQSLGGEEIMKGNKCKARSETKGELSEEELQEAEDELNFGSTIEEKVGETGVQG